MSAHAMAQGIARERICSQCGGPCSQDLVCRCQCHFREFCRSGWTNDQCTYKAGHDGGHSNERPRRRTRSF